MSIEVKKNVIKRSGEEVSFDLEKIINAIRKANKEVDRLHQMNEYQINAIADNIAHRVEEIPHAAVSYTHLDVYKRQSGSSHVCSEYGSCGAGFPCNRDRFRNL